MDSHFILGLGTVLAAGLFQGSFMLPRKWIHGWAWENTWLIFSATAYLFCPWIVALVTVPHLFDVFRATGAGTLLIVLLCGGGWGIGAILFGLGVEMVGLALGFAVIMGTAATVGSVIPMLVAPPGSFPLAARAAIGVALALMLVGVTVCSAAGKWKEVDGRKRAGFTGYRRGLLLCFASGLLSACGNLGFAFGTELTRQAQALGVSEQAAPNALWALITLPLFVCNGGYALQKLVRNGTLARFKQYPATRYAPLAVAMGVMWMLGISLYGIGARHLGTLGPSVGWAVLMSTMVLVSSTLGVLTGEWTGAPRGAGRRLFAGVLLLVLAIVAFSSVKATQTAQAALPTEIPLPLIKTSLGNMPGPNELPVRRGMPDVLTMNDGTKVTTLAQWQLRREEMKRILQHYATGAMPPPPGNVKGREVKAELVLDGTVKYRLVRLTFGPQEQLGLDIGIFTPVEGGPFPTIIYTGSRGDPSPPGARVLPVLPKGPGQGRGLDVLMVVGSAPHPAWPVVAPDHGGTGGGTAEELAKSRSEVFRRGYALVVYNNNDCAEDTTLREADGSFSFRHTRFFPAYPGYDWGVLAAWAWGASRIADYLDTDAAIDRAKLKIITGLSRAGKSAMYAAAFDERLMGAPVCTGGGGMGAYRFSGPRASETLDMMATKYPNWFAPALREFRHQHEKLPFDQHWFLALSAPRPFISLEGMTDVINLPHAVRQTQIAAQPAYDLHGVEDRIGVNYANHGHSMMDEDWNAIMDFADKNLRGMKVDRSFDRFPTDAELDAAAVVARAARTRAPAPR